MKVYGVLGVALVIYLIVVATYAFAAPLTTWNLNTAPAWDDTVASVNVLTLPHATVKQKHVKREIGSKLGVEFKFIEGVLGKEHADVIQLHCPGADNPNIVANALGFENILKSINVFDDRWHIIMEDDVTLVMDPDTTRKMVTHTLSNARSDLVQLGPCSNRNLKHPWPWRRIDAHTWKGSTACAHSWAIKGCRVPDILKRLRQTLCKGAFDSNVLMSKWDIVSVYRTPFNPWHPHQQFKSEAPGIQQSVGLFGQTQTGDGMTSNFA